MEEKVLIKSETNKKTKKIFCILIGIFFFASVILFLSLLREKEYPSYRLYGTYTMTAFEGAFCGYFEDWLTFIFACVFFVLAITFLIAFCAYRKCEIIITEKNVRGKTLFGKEVVLPVYMVSSYATRSFLSTIAISTSSGLTKFALISNYVEIGNVLAEKINERQDNTLNIESKSGQSNINMDDLVKLKTLLEQGIITQEEFDAKKKQLLDL